MGKEVIRWFDIIDLAREYNVDQYDILESFLCELLGVKPDELYMILDDDNE